MGFNTQSVKTQALGE